MDKVLESQENVKLFVDKLVDKNFDTKIVVDYHMPLEFNFWNAINNSGSLIILELDEIKHIENTYQLINAHSKSIEKSYRDWINLIGTKVPLNEIRGADKTELVHETVKYFQRAMELSEDLKKVIQEESEYLKWIKLDYCH